QKLSGGRPEDFRGEVKLAGQTKSTTFSLLPEAQARFKELKARDGTTIFYAEARLREERDYGTYIELTWEGTVVSRYYYYRALNKCTTVDFSRLSILDHALGNRNVRGEEIIPRRIAFQPLASTGTCSLSYRGRNDIPSLVNKAVRLIPQQNAEYGWTLLVYDQKAWEADPSVTPSEILVRDVLSQRWVKADPRFRLEFKPCLRAEFEEALQIKSDEIKESRRKKDAEARAAVATKQRLAVSALPEDVLQRYLPLVQRAAARFAQRANADDPYEYLSGAMLGLAGAYQNFPADHPDFIKILIVAMKRGMMNQQRQERSMTVTEKAKLSRINKAREQFIGEGVIPATEELAEASGLDVADINNVLAHAREKRISDFEGEDHDQALAEATVTFMRGAGAAAEEPGDRFADFMSRYGKGLLKDEVHILKRLFFDEDEPAQHEVAKEMGVSSSRVTQIFASLAQKLKTRLAGVVIERRGNFSLADSSEDDDQPAENGPGPVVPTGTSSSRPMRRPRGNGFAHIGVFVAIALAGLAALIFGPAVVHYLAQIRQPAVEFITYASQAPPAHIGLVLTAVLLVASAVFSSIIGENEDPLVAQNPPAFGRALSAIGPATFAFRMTKLFAGVTGYYQGEIYEGPSEVLNVMISARCRGNCTDCFADKNGKDMARKDIIALLDAFKGFKRINFVGPGETTEYGKTNVSQPGFSQDFIDIINHAATCCDEVGIVTSAYFVPEDKEAARTLFSQFPVETRRKLVWVVFVDHFHEQMFQSRFQRSLKAVLVLLRQLRDEELIRIEYNVTIEKGWNRESVLREFGIDYPEEYRTHPIVNHIVKQLGAEKLGAEKRYDWGDPYMMGYSVDSDGEPRTLPLAVTIDGLVMTCIPRAFLPKETCLTKFASDVLGDLDHESPADIMDRLPVGYFGTNTFGRNRMTYYPSLSRKPVSSAVMDRVFAALRSGVPDTAREMFEQLCQGNRDNNDLDYALFLIGVAYRDLLKRGAKNNAFNGWFYQTLTQHSQTIFWLLMTAWGTEFKEARDAIINEFRNNQAMVESFYEVINARNEADASARVFFKTLMQAAYLPHDGKNDAGNVAGTLLLFQRGNSFRDVDPYLQYRPYLQQFCCAGIFNYALDILTSQKTSVKVFEAFFDQIAKASQQCSMSRESDHLKALLTYLNLVLPEDARLGNLLASGDTTAPSKYSTTCEQARKILQDNGPAIEVGKLIHPDDRPRLEWAGDIYPFVQSGNTLKLSPGEKVYITARFNRRPKFKEAIVGRIWGKGQWGQWKTIDLKICDDWGNNSFRFEGVVPEGVTAITFYFNADYGALQWVSSLGMPDLNINRINIQTPSARPTATANGFTHLGVLAALAAVTFVGLLLAPAIIEHWDAIRLAASNFFAHAPCAPPAHIGFVPFAVVASGLLFALSVAPGKWEKQGWFRDIREKTPLNHRWKTALYDIDTFKIKYKEWKARKTVNRYRLMASLAHLLAEASPSDREKLLSFCMSIIKKYDTGRLGGNERELDSDIKNGQAYLDSEYQTAMEVYDAVAKLDSGYYTGSIPSNILEMGEKLKLVAHGTVGGNDRLHNIFPMPEIVPTLHRAQALLNIMIDGKVKPVRAGRAIQERADVGWLNDDLDPYTSAGLFGPYYVIFNLAPDCILRYPRLRDGSVARKYHAIYLVPHPRDVRFLLKGLAEAVRLGFKTSRDANWAGRRIMTYAQFEAAYKAGKLKRIIDNRKPYLPSDPVRVKATRSDVSRVVASGRARKSFPIARCTAPKERAARMAWPKEPKVDGLSRLKKAQEYNEYLFNLFVVIRDIEEIHVWINGGTVPAFISRRDFLNHPIAHSVQGLSGGLILAGKSRSFAAKR
ncbi:MAG: hypothetical protein HQL18_04830, partial [Candidatus Omnitrophica bacterium]|nr:hypothetical protein [Candidatus Omnitrophota bacterium]